MIELTQEELKQRFNDKIFGQISETADALGLSVMWWADTSAIFFWNALPKM